VGRRQVNDDSQPAVNHDWVNFVTRQRILIGRDGVMGRVNFSSAVD